MSLQEQMSETRVKLYGFGPYDNKQPIMPSFTLSALNGKKDKVSGWDYKQRNPLVIYLLPAADAEVFSQLETERAAYREYKAEVLALVRTDLGKLNELNTRLRLSYPLLADEDGAVFEKFLKLADIQSDTAAHAAVFITDRFGAATRYAVAKTPAMLPPVEEITATLDFLTNLCNP